MDLAIAKTSRSRDSAVEFRAEVQRHEHAELQRAGLLGAAGLPPPPGVLDFSNTTNSGASRSALSVQRSALIPARAQIPFLGTLTFMSLRDSPPAVSWTRREFLRAATGAALATPLVRSAASAAQLPRNRKAVVVTFGGGARDDETFMPEGHENIPRLLSTLLPQATFFPQVINRGILGHYVANASLATGAYQTINNHRRTAAAPDRILSISQRSRAACV
jgi:hypothetical protein